MIEDFDEFGGKHCWTTALRNVFAYHGLHLSEEMLFGLGGGLSFIYWYMKFMPALFTGGRYGKDVGPIINTWRRIGAEATVSGTRSAKTAYRELNEMLRNGEPAVVFADMVYLPYMVLPEEAPFGAHTVIVYGLDGGADKVFISDRSVKPLSISIEDLKRARTSKFPPFPPRTSWPRFVIQKRSLTWRRGSEPVSRKVVGACSILP